MSFVFVMLCVTSFLKAQHPYHLITEKDGEIYKNKNEFSGLARQRDKFYLLAEKCRKIMTWEAVKNVYGLIEFDEQNPLLFNSQLEGLAVLNDTILLSCDERNARIISINIVQKSVKNVDVVGTNLQEWTGNVGMEGIAIDQQRKKIFLLREKDNGGRSEVRIFNLITEEGNIILKVTDTLIFKHENENTRYSDIAYDSVRDHLLLLKSYYTGNPCSKENKYIIDTLELNGIFSGIRKVHTLKSKQLAFLNVSSYVTGLCGDYNTNLEGLTIYNNYLYLISDNAASDAPGCTENAGLPSLFIQFSLPASVQFDFSELKYRGTVQDQARLLLRQPLPKGDVSCMPPKIDDAFLNLLTTDFKLKENKLRRYLNANQINVSEVGGNINRKISTILNSKQQKVNARYFIIHDVSYEERGSVFPNNIDSTSYKANQFDYWTHLQEVVQKRYIAHVFINRPGESKTYVDFKDRKGTTKFEQKEFNKKSGLAGLYLSVELIQPRLRPNTNTTYFSIAPEEGFTRKQYERLALVYIVAGFRNKGWLIPAFHICIDEMLHPDSHDDPQNFDFSVFTDSVLKTISDIEKL